MLTKGAIGNLINRYKAVLTKCNLINTFGSLAVASMLVLGGAGVAGAVTYDSITSRIEVNTDASISGITVSGIDTSTTQGAVIYNNSTININNSKFNNNNGYSTGDARGGVIYNNNIVNIYNSTFDNNTSFSYKNGVISTSGGGAAGAIQNNKELNIYDSLFTSNKASKMGGALYNSGPGVLTISNTTFDGNKAGLGGTSDGGAIAMNGGSLISTGNIYQNNTATKDGGALTLQGTLSNVSFKNDQFIGNEADKNGGAIDIFYNDGQNITFSGTTFNGNTASDGGAINNRGKIAFEGINTFSGNEDKNGKNDIHNDGEIAIAADATVSLDGGITSTNTGTEDEPEYTGTITGEGSIEFTSTETKVQAKSIDKTVKAVASEALNDQLGGDLDAFKEQIGNKFEAKNIVMKAGMTAPGYENGKFSKNEVMDAVLQQASITMVSLDKILTNDVRKRLGDIRSDANTTGVWMRWDGGKMKGDSGLTNNFNTIQIGGDTKAAKNCRIGFAGSFTHGDMDFNLGGGELEGFSFALYGTWMGENGMFADVVARLGKFSTEMTGNGRKGDMDNRVASLSGEYGWRLPVCDQFFVEPQVELAYTYVSSDDLQLGEAHYEFDSVDSLTGRAGVVAGWNLPEERGNVYARASVVQQFMGDAKVTGVTTGKPVTQERDGEDTWLEYGIGANVKLTDSTYVWADVERTEGADIEEEWRGTVGVRFSF